MRLKKIWAKFGRLLAILLICLSVISAGKVLAQESVQAALTSPLGGEHTTGHTITITGTASSPNTVKGVYLAIKSPDNKYLQTNYTFQGTPQFFAATNTGINFSTWKFEISGDWFTRGVAYTILIGVNDGAWHEFSQPNWYFVCNNSNSKGVELASQETLREDNLNNASLTLRLSNMKFKSSILPGHFILNNFPAGASIAQVVLQDEYTAVLIIAFDGTDFDDDREIAVTVEEAALSWPWNKLPSNPLQLTANKDSLTIVPESPLAEKTLHGAVLNVQLDDTVFRDEELMKENFLLLNAPGGLSIERVVYLDPVRAKIFLDFNGLDFDEDIEDFCLLVKASEISGAADLTSNTIVIRATVESSEKEIISFAVEGQIQEALIDRNNYTVTFRMPYGTAVTSLLPIIAVSEGAFITPGSGEPQDFSSPVLYAVTAEDLSVQDWIVTCIVEPPAGHDNNDEESKKNPTNEKDGENDPMGNDGNNNGNDNAAGNNSGMNATRPRDKTKKSDDDILGERLKNTWQAVFTFTGPEGKAAFSLDLLDKLVKNKMSLIMEKEGWAIEFPPDVLKFSLWEQALKRGHSHLEILIREINDAGTKGGITKALAAETGKIAAIVGKIYELSVRTYSNGDIPASNKEITSFIEPVPVIFDLSFTSPDEGNKLSFCGLRLDRGTDDKPVLLGGSFAPLQKNFTFHTDKCGILTVGQVENLVTMSLTLGNRFGKINGVLRESDVSPELRDNHVMVPLRLIGESLGAEFLWDGETGTVTVKQGSKESRLKIDQPLPGLAVSPVLMNGRTLVPVSFIAESFGAHVMWFPKPGTVYIVNR